MAIYKNREVSIVGPTYMASAPKTIVIKYNDGTNETVTLSQVHFTQAEKDTLVKAFPSEYDGVTVASEDDLKAVRVGVAPSSDPSYREQAEADKAAKEAQEQNQKQIEAARKNVESQSASDSKK